MLQQFTLGKHRFLPGDEVPQAGAYQEHDPRVADPVGVMLLAKGDRFPAVQRQGGFFTLADRVQKPRPQSRWSFGTFVPGLGIPSAAPKPAMLV